MIVTKSDLILRDLDLLTSGKCIITMSITCEPRYKEKSYWEPYSPSIDRRIETVKTLNKKGIFTNVNVYPILPYSNPIEIIDHLNDYANFWVFEKLNDENIDKELYVSTRIKIIEIMSTAPWRS